MNDDTLSLHSKQEEASLRQELNLGLGACAERNLASTYALLSRTPEISSAISYNEFTSRVVLLKSPPWAEVAVGSVWSDNDDRLATAWVQRQG
jgi:hypothetical protein